MPDFDDSYTNFLNCYLDDYKIGSDNLNRAVYEASDYMVAIAYGRQAIPPYAIWRRLDQDESVLKPLSVLYFKDMIMLLAPEEVALLRSLLVRYNPWKEMTYDVQAERKKVTSKLRFQVMARDKFTCQLCGALPKSSNNDIVLAVDHIIPVSKGGKTDPGNLHTLCNKCNSGKGDTLVDDLVDDNLLYQPPKDSYHPYAEKTCEFLWVKKPLSKLEFLFNAITNLFS